MAITASQLVAKVAVEGDTEAKSKLDSMGKASDQASQKVKSGLLASVKNTASGLLDFGAKIGQTVIGFKGIADAAVGFGQALLGPNAEFEQTRVSFEAFIPDAKQLTATLAGLQKFAAVTPFESKDVDQAALSLLNMDVKAQDLTKWLGNIGAAVAKIGGNGVVFQDVAAIISQMGVKGKVTTEEMLQLTERNIPAFKILANAMGVPVATLQDMISKSQLGQDKIDLLVQAMGKFGGDAMVKQGQTFIGLLSTVQDNARLALMAFTGPLFDQAKTGLQALGDLVSSPAFQDFAKVLGVQVGTAIQSVVTAVSGLLSKGSPLVGFFQQIAQGWKNFTTDAEGNSAIPGIIDAFGRLQSSLVRFGQTIGPSLGATLTSFNGLLTTTAGWISSLVAPALDSMGQRVDALGAFLAPILPALSGLSIAVSNLVNAIGPVLVGIATFTSQSGLLSVALGLVGTAVSGVINLVSGIVNGIADVIRFFSQNQVAAALLTSALGALAIAFAAFKITSFVQGLASCIPIFYTMASIAIPGLITGLGELAVATWTAMGPFLPFLAIGAAVVAVVAGIILAVRNWATITTFLQQQWTRFTSWFNGVLDSLSNVPGIGGLVQALRGAWASISANAKTAWDNISANASSAFASIQQKGGELGAWFQSQWGDFSVKASNTGGKIGQAFNDAWALARRAWNQSPLAGAFDTIVKSFQNLGPTIQKTLQDQFAPIGAGLSQVGPTLQGQLATAFSGLSPAFDNLKKSFGDAWSQLQQSGQLIGSIVGPAWRDFQNTVSQLAQIVGGQFGQAWQTTQQTLSQVGQVVSSTLAPAWKSLQDSLAQVGVILSGAFGQAWATLAPVLAQIAATVGGQLAQAWATMAPILAQIAQTVGGALAQAWQFLQPVLAQIGQMIGGQLLVALQAIGIVIGGVVLVAISLLLGVIVGLAQAFATFIAGLANVVAGIVQIFSGIAQIASGFVALIVDLFTGNFSKLGADLGVIWSGVVTMFSGIWQTIVGLFQASVGTVASFVSGLVNTVIQFFTNLYNQLVGHSIIPDMINGIITWFQSLPTKVITFITQLVTSGLALFANLQKMAVQYVTVMGQNIITSLGNLKNQATTQASNIVTGIANFFTSLPGKATQWMSDFGNNLVSGLKGMIQKVKDAASSVAQSITDVLHNTEPDEGPMKGNTQWMIHFGENLVSGLNASVGKVNAASQNLAASIAQPFTGASGGQASTGIIPAGATPIPASSQASPTIVVNVPPSVIEMDGIRLTNTLMPLIVQAIRRETGGRI